ncbi:MAG TPA: glutamate racemase [Aquifex aeolicus]|nr:glutamate racemase [Aquificales bacterium]HIQ26745.1 glutamate racemase [Aquifex aeolicus]
MESKPFHTLKVGVFDSGLGGLTVLSELTKVSSGVKFFYLGDTARVPYGIRSDETIVEYSLECARFLLKFGIDVLVIACNTASAKATESLKKEFPFLKIFEVITPAVDVVSVTAKSSVGIIGTPATVESNVYLERLEFLNPSLEIFQKPTPLLVPLVEEGLTDGKVVFEVLKHYLWEWKEKIDTLLLGCTHYPLLEYSIKKLFPHWGIVNSAKPLAQKLKPILNFGGKNEIRLYFTDKTAFLEEMVYRIPLKGKIKRLEIGNLL